MSTRPRQRSHRPRPARGRVLAAVTTAITLAVCCALGSPARAEDGATLPPYDDAVLSEIAQQVLTGPGASAPEASVPDPVASAAVSAARASDAAADVATAPGPETSAADLEPAVEAVTVAIPPGFAVPRTKPEAASTSAYRSNSFRQRGGTARALSFSSGAMAPASGLDATLTAKADELRSAGRDHVYGFVLLRAPLDERTEDKLAELGVRLLGRHDDHHKARLPIAALPAIAAMPEVEWVGVSRGEQKASPELAQLRVARASAAAVDETSPVPVIINLFEADEDGSFARAIEDAGAALGDYDADLHFYRAVATGPVLERLQALDFVLFVDLIGLNPPGHDQSVTLLDADLVRPGPVTYGLTRFGGAPVPVGIIDSGAAVSVTTNGHMDLTSKRACGRNFTSKPEGPYIDLFGHGTHVLGSIAGTGAASARYTGVAPGVGDWLSGGHVRIAKVWDENGQGNTDTVLMDAMDWMTLPGECSTAPVDPAPMVINYSGGAGENLVGTDPVSRKADYRTWINAQLYVVCSGNGGGVGTIGRPGVAKNVLAVGNVLDNGYQTVGDLKPTSSRGPTGDGRMKPNVVAPGTTITSARAGTTNQYTNLDGCSMATPHVTGLAASLMHHYPVFQFKPALLRAHLMATAMGHDGAVGKSNEYGLGRVSGYVAHWDHPNSDGWQTTRHWGTINSNGFAYGDVVVPPGAKRLVVVMTWDEPPASAGASRAVMNDIDLYIDRDVDCGDPTGACGEYVSVSTVDNVEYVVVHDPPPGTYRMKVVPTDASPTILPWGMSAVVIRGDVLPGARVVSPPAMRTYTSGPTTVAVGSLINIAVGVANDSYVASGVQVQPVSVPNGVLPLEIQTSRLDGVTMSFPSNQTSVTLGNIPPSWSRTATYPYLAQTAGSKTFTYRVWSENSGEQTVSRTINVVSGSLTSDLMVTSVSTTPGAPSGAPGSKFTATSTVLNGGTSAAGASKTRYYLSSDATRSGDDLVLTGTRSVAGLAPGASLSGSVTVTVPTSASSGQFFLLACADDASTVGETDEANNCLASAGAIVTVGTPDLVEGGVTSPPASRKRGTSFSTGDSAQNAGTVASKATKTRYYLSADQQKGASDRLLTGARAVPALAPGASHTGSKSVKIPAATPPGTYYVLACADDTKAAAESSETNNCAASATTVSVTP